jgi:hypothetical protein
VLQELLQQTEPQKIRRRQEQHGDLQRILDQVPGQSAEKTASDMQEKGTAAGPATAIDFPGAVLSERHLLLAGPATGTAGAGDAYRRVTGRSQHEWTVASHCA